MTETETAQVRRAIEKQLGKKLSDQQFIVLIGNVIKDLLAQRDAIARRGGIPVIREPTNFANTEMIVNNYPKTLETIVRELSIYQLRGKSDGTLIEGNMMWGIAVAITDHILKAGELK